MLKGVKLTKKQRMLSSDVCRENGSGPSATRGAELEECENEALCGICLCGTNEVAAGACYELECGHAFHTRCIVNWFRRKSSRGACPVCRSTPSPAGDREHGDAGDQVGSAPPSGSEDSVDLDTVLVLTETEMHRVCAHVIYRSSANRPPWESDIVSAYMAARRRLRNARGRQTRGRFSQSQLQRAYTAAARKLLIYVSWRDGLALLQMTEVATSE